jgi:hypothetical protein
MRRTHKDNIYQGMPYDEINLYRKEILHCGDDVSAEVDVSQRCKKFAGGSV